ncbi:MAG: S41 family peptidase [Desulfotomaculum sp.]|nr:S41 family peptidase [Desulfotomaculum sp.]
MDKKKLGFFPAVFTVVGLASFLMMVTIGFMVFFNYSGLGNLVKTIVLIKTQYLYSDDLVANEMVEGAIKGLVESLEDPYSVFLQPEIFKQLNEQIHGSFGGLGILVSMENEYIVVVRPFEGTPAAKVGLKTGDIITKIDAEDVKGMNLELAVKKMRGPVGAEISLTVSRPGEPEVLNFNLVREEIRVPTVEGRMLNNRKIGYITLMKFTENTPVELAEILETLKNQEVQGLILDLRNNPGGELMSAVRVVDKFISEGAIVHIDCKLGNDHTYTAEEPALDLPLVVLQNSRTTSAAEILAGAIKDHNRGQLVGTTSFGKGVVQTVFQLDGGAGLKLTTARYLTPDKHDINKLGIEPDVYVEQPVDVDEDIQLQKALEIIENQVRG